MAQLEPATVLLLIPIFFALTGIKANLLFTSGSGAYLDMLLILVVAVISKWGGAALTARWMGLPWPEALQLGLLVELIVLNVGLEAGVISGTLYSMLVFMAIVTTVMATPIIDWIRRRPKTLVRVSAG